MVGIHVPARYRPGDSRSIRIDEIAASYVERIRAIQPTGPYHLAGFCFGGIVAYEATRQLEGAGEAVAQLAILDGGLPGAFRGRSLSRAREIGLDVGRFKAAVASGKFKARIQEDDALASRLGIDGTPTLVVNGEKVVGAVPFENLKAVIDRKLAAK